EGERPDELRDDSRDNSIIATAWRLHEQGLRAVFVSKDLNARIKSDALGIRTEDFENQKVDADRLYTGYLQAPTPGALIDEMYDERMLPLERLTEPLTATTPDGETYERELSPNQFILMQDEQDEN